MLGDLSCLYFRPKGSYLNAHLTCFNFFYPMKISHHLCGCFRIRLGRIFSLFELIAPIWHALSSTLGSILKDSASNCLGILESKPAQVLSLPARYSILQLYLLNFNAYCWIFLFVQSASSKYWDGLWSVLLVNTATLR